MVGDESLGYFYVLCGALVAALWVMLFRLHVGRFRFALWTLLVLVLMEAAVFWLISLSGTTIRL